MTPIELYEACKPAIKSERYSTESYFIPVKVGEEVGKMNPGELIDNLVRLGEITEDTTFSVGFGEEGEGWFPLGQIEIAGETQIF